MKQKFISLLSFVLCFLLIAASATCISCTRREEDPIETPKQGENTPESEGDGSPAPEGDPNEQELGNGQTAFLLEVIDGDGRETVYTIHTDKRTVGDALQELGLVEGEAGAYGLYVKKVCGILADYEINGTYWAFYVGGEYAMSGVDKTEIENGATYTLKVEKG